MIAKLSAKFKEALVSGGSRRQQALLAMLAIVAALVVASCTRKQGEMPLGPTSAPASPVPVLKTHARHFLSHDDFTSNPAEVLIGQRLFRETRFSQFFFANSGGNPNAEVTTEEAIMKYIKTPVGSTPNPYSHLGGINCASCHLIDEARTISGAGMRSYTDFQPRSFIPDRGDGMATTLRNAPTMVNVTKYEGRMKLFHSDGQFGNLEDLVRETYVGRNFGWLPSETETARKNLANVIRMDDGKGLLAHDYGGDYATLLKGEAKTIPESYKLPPEFRIDVARATDAEIAKGVSKLVAAFIDSLVYSVDGSGNYDGSPYDAFLKKNQLPQRPSKGETDQAYATRLASAIQNLKTVRYISPLGRNFDYQSQEFLFGETELTGLKLFLKTSAPQGQVGNCVHCHAPPHFTDFSFHNTGVSQVEYDGVHGAGKFLSLKIPELSQRSPLLLPPTSKHPMALGLFAQIPTAGNPSLVDLGFWNVFANPDSAAPGEIRRQLCKELKDSKPDAECDEGSLLSAAIARFKTPSLRDLGQSSPYGHNGSFQKIEEAVNFYRAASDLERAGQLRNGDEALKNIHLDENSVVAVSAFLRALNEDYH